MKCLRAVLVIGSMLALSASTLSAQGTQVTCKDGSKSAGGQGACSGHGGISSKATMKADVKAAKAEAKADAKQAKADAKLAKTEVQSDAKSVKAQTEAKAAKVEAKADARAAKVEARADAKAAKVAANAKAAKADAKMDAKMAMDDKDANGATAVCKDKTYSHAKTHQGACSSHGGVSKFLDGK